LQATGVKLWLWQYFKEDVYTAKSVGTRVAGRNCKRSQAERPDFLLLRGFVQKFGVVFCCGA